MQSLVLNAVDKTTVLEAIRLAKAVLAPRTQNEAGQALQSLRIAVPNLRYFGFSRCFAAAPISWVACGKVVLDRIGRVA
jgi:hypothetical protein